MAWLEKLLEKMRRLPPEMRYEEVERVLRAYGFEEVRSSGSHHLFRHPDGRMLTVPKHRGQVVKATYLKKVLEAIGEEEA
ncbi:MAG: type II toxin-antitoxin system HicA family toxin [Meiothermus sp.]|uniref:type II toxin-antitoxin system HicA family toxin n=1 Tax=Meiothermus sp. TaxID=1955249 RepID=UPI0025FE115B|nr:type II toxin-antitoxin system HicA family toxin [Meiothermus sp.]MCS7069239.1 type II toxin-antitoxin system HicA family toxin [Meiothermus sp.]